MLLSRWGETISRPDVMVQDIITNATAYEIGITINGVLAMVYNNQFVANHVPLEEGENTITAPVTDTEGNTAEASINVTALTTEDYIRLTADPESGIPPLETTLRVEGSFSFTEEATVRYTGPRTVEFLDNPNANKPMNLTRIDRRLLAGR